MLVAVAGDFDGPRWPKKLDALFADWPFTGEAAPPVPKPSHTLAPGTFLVDKDVNQGRVSILLPGPPARRPGLLRRRRHERHPRRRRLHEPHHEPRPLGRGPRLLGRLRSFSGGVWYPGRFGASFQSKVRTAAYALADRPRGDEEAPRRRRHRRGAGDREALVRRDLPAPLRDEGAGRGALLATRSSRAATRPTRTTSPRYRGEVEKVTKADAKRVARAPPQARDGDDPRRREQGRPPEPRSEAPRDVRRPDRRKADVPAAPGSDDDAADHGSGAGRERKVRVRKETSAFALFLLALPFVLSAQAPARNSLTLESDQRPGVPRPARRDRNRVAGRRPRHLADDRGAREGDLDDALAVRHGQGKEDDAPRQTDAAGGEGRGRNGRSAEAAGARRHAVEPVGVRPALLGRFRPLDLGLRREGRAGAPPPDERRR